MHYSVVIDKAEKRMEDLFEYSSSFPYSEWIPACAGMTSFIEVNYATQLNAGES